jgi:DNA-binding transcriptional LysR family regulator
MNNMHINELDLNLLSILEAMLRSKNVSKAALGLGLSQSAVSHAVKRLRQYFDDPLFVKTGFGMEPTPKAISLQDSVMDVMALIRQRIVTAVSFNPKTAKRMFTLCITDMGELVFLPTLLTRLRKEAPYCSIRTLQVPAEQIAGLLASGEADLAIGSYSGPDGLYKQLLFMHGFSTIAHVDNKKIKTRLSLKQFEQSPQIVVTLSGQSSTAYDSVLEDSGVKRTILLRTPHFLIVPLLIEQQPDLIATVPQELANFFARYEKIRAVVPPIELPHFAINQHWHPLFHHEPALIWLRDLIKESFENYPAIYCGE